MLERIQKNVQKGCDIAELIVAVIVGVGLVVLLIAYLPAGAAQLLHASETDIFLTFLQDRFNLVVWIEFIKILCRPSVENVIEMLVFLVARHMIISANDALDIFLSVLSVCLLYGIRTFLRRERRRRERETEQG